MNRILYVLVARRHSHDLTGAGGMQVDGRWHYRGTPCLYACDSPSRCLVEQFEFTSNVDVKDLVFVVLEVPDGFFREFSRVDLPEDFTKWPFPESSRRFGTRLLQSGEVFLLSFPSALFPGSAISKGERIYVLNAAHPMMKFVKILGVEELPDGN